MVHDLEPARSLNLRKMIVRKAIVNAKIPYTSVAANCFAGYFEPNLYQLGSFLPPKDKISIFGDNNAKDSDVAESKQRNCRTVDIRVDDGHIAKVT
ncbi:hypothetical protein Syun_031168 [Stephania yunnanensis]|uniref:Uncharacterized protein n=1 Tax=Stephania yunnanensis TaxID=152371 RepID=A0AAP0HF92_9MAGN